MDNSEILELKEIVTGSLEKILKFIDCSQFEIDECKKLIAQYKEEKDDENKRQLRRTLNNVFFNTYRECVIRSLELPGVPIQVQMFLLFGYMDEGLAGIANAVALCKLCEEYGRKDRKNAISLYEWLCMIYNGKRMPSMNEMSVDYEQMLREKLKTKEITESEFDSQIRDRHQRLNYEINNAFSMMRIVSGTPTRFLAIFNEASLEKPLTASYIVNKTIEDELEKITNVDVRLFAHEYTYANPSVGIENVRVQREILPDIILLPMIGSHPMMWQEIEGRNRQSAARFFYPRFLNSDLRDSLIRCCGTYRWEYCKREQGARWQDISDPSLCAYFNNYIQTFKKNHQLSQEQKEKVHAQYTKFRHNIRDIFLDDYVKFIANEAEGNIRLNRASRAILMRFCILNRDIRSELVKNTLYAEYINAVNNQIEREKKLLSNMKKRVDDNGAFIPPEIREFEMIVNR